MPELGRFLGDYARRETTAAVADMNERHPYWFVAKGEETDGEGTLQPLYDTISNFQAMAQVLDQSRQQLEAYLDIPGFERGDLFYIQKLLGVLEARRSQISRQ